MSRSKTFFLNKHGISVANKIDSVFLVLPSLVVADLGISSSVAVWNFGFVS